MTEDDGDLAHDAKERFWEEFRWLVRRTLDSVPEHVEDDLRYMLQDSTSCFHPGIPERGESRAPNETSTGE